MDANRSKGIPDSPLLRALEKRLTSHFDHSTQAGAVQQLGSFDVEPDVSFVDFLRQCQLPPRL